MEATQRQEAFQILIDSDLFGKLKKEILIGMIEECEKGKWKKNESIDPYISTEYLHIILSGRLKISQVDPKSGRSVAMFLLSSRDIFDVFSLLDGKEHIVQPVALDHVEYLRIPIVKAREWMKKHPEFNEAFLPYLGNMMRDLEAFGESLVFHDTLTRLARLILRHVPHYHAGHHDHIPVQLLNNLTHESLAEMIGSVRSVVSTQIHRLKQEGAVISDRGHLAIADMEKLIETLNQHTYL